MNFANPREITASLLLRWEQGRDAADDLLHGALARSSLEARDRALVTELFYGCLRQRAALDWLAAQKSNKPPKASVAVLARLGLYQLFFLDKVPVHAAVNETVELAKSKASKGEVGFLNAMLRAAHRERDALRAALERQSLAVRFSHPDWLVARWLARYNEAEVRTLLEWNNRPPSLFVRVNALKTDTVALLAKLNAAGADAIAWEKQTGVIELRRGASPDKLPGFAEGDFYVQDPSTLLAVDLLGAQPGERVLDACAAPGGKATYLAALMQNRGEIIAEDSSAERLKLVVANCARLGVACVTARAARAADASETWFDRVMLDVPCSNTGVLRRRVDARWRLSPEAVVRVVADQERLLRLAAQRVKRGGVLVYSTCSLEPEENRGVVESFLQANTGFTLEQIVETFPPRDGVDGMFAARLRRSGGA